MTSRRSHVVRSEDKGGVGPSRSLGGCQIFCAVEECGDINPGDHAIVAPVTIAASRNYQRCFVSATVGSLSATVPDPPPVPGPGSWTVRFECPIEVTDQWSSNPYYPPGFDVTLDQIRWAHTGPGDTSTGLDYAWLQRSDEYVEFYQFRYPSGIEAVNAVSLPTGESIWLGVKWQYGPMWVELSFSSPQGEDVQDVTISEGTGG